VNAGARQAIGGFQRGVRQARACVEQSYQAELGANKQIHLTQVDAADKSGTRDLKPLKLRQAVNCRRWARDLKRGWLRHANQVLILSAILKALRSGFPISQILQDFTCRASRV
jgi:hypothetical protein